MHLRRCCALLLLQLCSRASVCSSSSSGRACMRARTKRGRAPRCLARRAHCILLRVAVRVLVRVWTGSARGSVGMLVRELVRVWAGSARGSVRMLLVRECVRVWAGSTCGAATRARSAHKG